MEEPFKRFIGLPDVRNDLVEMLLHLENNDLQNLLNTSDTELQACFQLNDLELAELLNLKELVNCPSRDQIAESVRAFEYIRVIYNQIAAETHDSAITAPVRNDNREFIHDEPVQVSTSANAVVVTENNSDILLGKSFADLNVDDFE